MRTSENGGKRWNLGICRHSEALESERFFALLSSRSWVRLPLDSIPKQAILSGWRSRVRVGKRAKNIGWKEFFCLLLEICFLPRCWRCWQLSNISPFLPTPLFWQTGDLPNIRVRSVSAIFCASYFLALSVCLCGFSIDKMPWQQTLIYRKRSMLIYICRRCNEKRRLHMNPSVYSKYMQ